MRNPFLQAGEQPLVVGHRGVPTLHHENSLAGFVRAVSLGVPAVELDVRLTSDRRAVVCHDNDLSRLAGDRVLLSATSWARLNRMRMTSKLPMGIDHRGQQVTIDYGCEGRFSLLEEVFAEVGGKLAFNIELKLDTAPWWRADVGTVVARLVDRYQLQQSVVITSFDLRKLRAAKAALPSVAVGFCYDDSMLDVLRPLLSRRRAMALLRRAAAANLTGAILDADVVGIDHTLVDRTTVKQARQRGVMVGTYTLFPVGSTTGKPIEASASDASELRRLEASGVRWIETDDPVRALDALER